LSITVIRDWSRADRSATLDCFLLPLPADERIEPEVDEARGAGAILERIAAAVITYANGTGGQRVWQGQSSRARRRPRRREAPVKFN